MSTMRTIVPEAGLFVFDTIHVTETAVANDLVDLFAAEVDGRCGNSPGFRSARAHLGLDGDVMVTRLHWTDEARYRSYQAAVTADGDPFHDRLQKPDVLDRRTFEGTQVTGFEGPAIGAAVGFAVVTTRYLRDRADVQRVHDVLLETGQWKHEIPGFVSATPYVSLDGTTFVNNPQWIDDAAFEVYMAHPGISSVLKEVLRLEVGPRSEVLCRLAPLSGKGAYGESDHRQ